MEKVHERCGLIVEVGEATSIKPGSRIPVLFKCDSCAIDTTVLIDLGLTAVAENPQILKKLISEALHDSSSVAFRNLRSTRSSIVIKNCQALKSLR